MVYIDYRLLSAIGANMSYYKRKVILGERDMDIDKVLGKDESNELFELLDHPPTFKVDKNFEKTKEKISNITYIDELKQKELRKFQKREAALQKRKSKLNDSQFKYAYNTDEKILHDRSCELIKKIPDEYFDMLKEADYNMRFCRKCHVRALIRNCIDDQNDICIVEKILKRAYAKHEDVIGLFARKNIQMKCISDSIIEIKINDDKWRIIIENENDKLVLMHNNYHIENGNRIIEQGFHRQTVNGRQSFKAISQIIINYKSSFHVEKAQRLITEEKRKCDKYLELAPDNDIEIVNDYFNIATVVKLKKFAIIYNRYMFVDTKVEHYKKVFQDRQISYKTIDAVYCAEFVYGIIVCDVPKWHRRKMFSAINRIKRNIYKEGHKSAYLCAVSMKRYLDRNKIKYLERV